MAGRTGGAGGGAWADLLDRAWARARCAAAPVLLAGGLVAWTGCGGGDDCSGFLSVNADPARCEALARQFGCDKFETTQATCGLFGCIYCGDIPEEPTPTPASTPAPTPAAAS